MRSLFVDVVPEYTGALHVFPEGLFKPGAFTVTTRFGDKVRLDRPVGPGYVGLPWGLATVSPDDRRVPGYAVYFDCCVVPRNEDQERVIAQSSGLLRKGVSHIIQASTGFGKTVCGAAIIARAGVKTLVVVPKADLVEQWTDELKQFLNLEDDEIGIICQDKVEVMGKKVVIGMLKSLAIEDRYPEWVREEFGLVVFDEVHRLGAETFSRVAYLFPSMLRLGLSATADRSDGKEFVFTSHIGKVRVTAEVLPMVPKVLVYQSGWQCPRRPVRNKETGEVTLKIVPHKAGRTGWVTKRLVEDEYRNRLLASMVLTAYNKGRRVLFFSHSRGHLEVIEELLIRSGVPEGAVAHYKGGMSKKALEIARTKPVLNATYGFAKEGTNIPEIGVCVLGSPLADIRQAVGRITREMDGKQQPVVIDIRDDDSPVFRGYGMKRDRQYQAMGAVVKIKRLASQRR